MCVVVLCLVIFRIILSHNTQWSHRVKKAFGHFLRLEFIHVKIELQEMGSSLFVLIESLGNLSGVDSLYSKLHSLDMKIVIIRKDRQWSSAAKFSICIDFQTAAFSVFKLLLGFNHRKVFFFPAFCFQQLLLQGR